MTNQAKRQMDSEARRMKRSAPDELPHEIGSLIRAQRLIREMSQEELGDRIGVTFQQIQNYEKGRSRVSAGRLVRIAEILKVPVSFFLTGAAPSTAVAKDLARRVQRTIQQAERVFGDSRKAQRWLHKPKRALNGQTPFEILTDEAGARRVEEMLYQIDDGMHA
jgi:transcriptional regulator with XRE-family HTH domain